MTFNGFFAIGWIRVDRPGAERLWMLGERSDSKEFVVASWGSNLDPQPGQEWAQGYYVWDRESALRRFAKTYDDAVRSFGFTYVGIDGESEVLDQLLLLEA